MRKDQGLFLAAGVVLGLVVGLVFGYVLFGGGGPRPRPAGQARQPRETPRHGEWRRPDRRSPVLRRAPRTPGPEPERRARARRARRFPAAAAAAPEAISHYERALAGDPGNAQIMGRVAVGYRTAHQPKKALEMAMKMLDAERNDAQAAALAFDVALHGAGDLDAAGRRWPSSNAARPVRRWPARCSRPRRHPEGHRGRRTKLDDFDAQSKAGNFYYDTAQWSLSEAAYRRAMAINPLAAG